MSSRLSAPGRDSNSSSTATSTRPSARSRSALVAAVLALGAGAVGLQGSPATFADEKPRSGGPTEQLEAEAERPGLAILQPTNLVPAKRGKTVPTKPSYDPVAPPTTQPPAGAITRPVSEEQRVIDLTNETRVAAGLAPLRVNAKLNQAALAHAVDQRNALCAIGHLTHIGTDGSTGAERILRTGLNISRWGENIACAFRSSDMVMRGWMASPGHAANIMNPLFTEIGVAIAASDTGQLYWVQVFATLR